MGSPPRMTQQRTTRQRTVLPPAQRARMTTKSSRQQQGVEAPRSAPVVVRIEEGEFIWELRMRQEEETRKRIRKKKIEEEPRKRKLTRRHHSECLTPWVRC